MTVKIRDQAHYDSLREGGVTPLGRVAVYLIWYDNTSDSWEVVRWEGSKRVTVQRNIQTKDKALIACNLWRKREAAR